MTRDEILNIVHNMPESPGVYQYFNEEGTIIYVGKAKNLKKRVSSYFNRDLTFEEYRHYIGYAGCTALYWMTWGLYKGSVNEDDGFFMFDSYKLCKNLVKKALPMYENEEK